MKKAFLTNKNRNMKIFILYSADFNHTHNSKNILGVYTNKQILLKDAKSIISNDVNNDDDVEGSKKDDIKWHFDFLVSKYQTQGLSEFELIIEEFESNTLI